MSKTKTRPSTPNWLPRSLVLFAVIFGVLVFPWPGLDDAYGAYFRAFGSFFLSRDDSPRIVRFERNVVTHDFTTVDTRMTLANRASIDAQGRIPVVQTSLNARSIGWMPTALTVALIAASPVPWKRRLIALAAGLVAVHLLILASLQTALWSESSGLGLLHLSPAWQSTADALKYTCLDQMGISFTAPVLIWLLVTFRVEDASRFSSASGAQNRRSPRARRNDS